MVRFDLAKESKRTKLNSRSKVLGRLDGRTVGISRFAEHPRWEMHPNGDELLQIVEGKLELTLLLGKRNTPRVLRRDDVVVIPKGVWHSPIPRGSVCLLHIADYRGTKISNAEDPR